MKRKIPLLLVGVVMTATVFAQNRMSGGISAGANYSNLNGDKDVVGGDGKFGVAGGLFLNFPLSNSVSISPSVLYSQMGAKLTFTGDPALHYKQTLGYISVPVALKFNAGKSLALFLGPQFDFLASAKLKNQDNDNKTDNKDNFQSFDVAGTIGGELFPNSPVSLTIRYIHGFKNILNDNGTTPGLSGTSFHNRAAQATLNFKLWGNKKKTVAVTTPEVPVVTPPPAPINYDTDNDGVPDSVDKCPSVAGSAKYNGCPVPDTDGDGINDDNDKCPTVAGVERYNGCPIPDTDGDGVNDEEDNCPSLAGPASNHGCPEVDNSTQSKVDVMAKNITWAPTSSYTISTRSNKSLDQIASMLKADPNLKVNINVHTSNAGDDEKNKTLTQSRANAIKDYLVKQGVNDSQITATGYGEEQPIADNGTAAGRAKNNRVEVKLHY